MEYGYWVYWLFSVFISQCKLRSALILSPYPYSIAYRNPYSLYIGYRGSYMQWNMDMVKELMQTLIYIGIWTLKIVNRLNIHIPLHIGTPIAYINQFPHISLSIKYSHSSFHWPFPYCDAEVPNNITCILVYSSSRTIASTIPIFSHITYLVYDWEVPAVAISK